MQWSSPRHGPRWQDRLLEGGALDGHAPRKWWATPTCRGVRQWDALKLPQEQKKGNHPGCSRECLGASGLTQSCRCIEISRPVTCQAPRLPSGRSGPSRDGHTRFLAELTWVVDTTSQGADRAGSQDLSAASSPGAGPWSSGDQASPAACEAGPRGRIRGVSPS